MLIGKSRLAVWRRTDQTVRLFELDNTGVFVQVTAFSGPTGADVISPTILSFSNNGDFIVTLDKVSKASDVIQFRSTDFFGNQLFQNLTGDTGAATQDTYFGIILSRPDANSIQASFGQLLAYGSDLGDFAGIQNTTAFNYSFNVFVMDQAQTRAVFLRSDFLRFASVNVSNQRATFNLTPSVPLSGRVPQCADWTRDGRYCAIGWDNGDIEIYSVSGSTFSLLSTTNIGEIVNQVKWRFDGRVLAVGHGATPNTTLYTRHGVQLALPTVLAGIGSNLLWTADGQYLLDVITKKAYQWSSEMVMTPADGAMVNIPAGIVTSAISPHVDTPLAEGLMYDKGFRALVNKTVDLNNLKFALLDGGAPFDRTAVDATNAVISNHEIFSADFPQGGTLLQNVNLTFSSVASIATLAADDILVANTQDLTFAQALVYDATNNTPLALFDYGTQTMNSFYTQQFALSDGFITYST